MNAFFSLLEKHNDKTSIKRSVLTTLQVNMGNLCNQSCKHCHIDASPSGEKIMSRKIVDNILNFLTRYEIKTLDITGGAPELNPNFENLVLGARSLVDEIIVRSNLTVYSEKDKDYLPEFFKKNKIHLICSLPCYLQENVESQRGKGSFKKSIKALQILNNLGFAKVKGLYLDLVYNPAGPSLPPEQKVLEKKYKVNLFDSYNVEFNRLLTITNVPIKRFKEYLELNGQYDDYFKLLKKNFNPLVIDQLMCRSFLSVGYDGKVYDCDFNQALGLALKSESNKFLTINNLEPKKLEGKDIAIGEHCLTCTAGSGSSCKGALQSKKDTQYISNITMLEEGVSKKELVKDYYGKILKNKKDLKTSACCTSSDFPKIHKDILKKIEPEILDKFYGCGSPLPPELKGMQVLDLGCGAGRDVYLASHLVGQEGFVTGIDMTDEQLAVARKYKDIQAEKFGFRQPNVDFKKGYIEDLISAGIKNESIDVVISNCVINLSPDKKEVFKEIFRVLKPGGEIYFSDVFSGRRVPEEVKNDPVLYGECLGGALYIEDFRRMLLSLGYPDYRVVSKKAITLNNSELEAKAGMIDFYSMTIRIFKLENLEDICEDYGQVATYLGTAENLPHSFTLDDHHLFIKGKPMLVCGNTASMLNKTRYSRHFRLDGNRDIHYGAFDCSGISQENENNQSESGGCC